MKWTPPLTGHRRWPLPRPGTRAAVLAGALALWEAGVDLHLIDPFYTSAPSAIFATVLRWLASGSILPHALSTLAVTLTGLVGGALLGIGAGIGLAASPGVRAVILPLLSAANAAPRLILYPLIALWLGFGTGARIVLVVTLTVFPVLLTTDTAIRAVDRDVVRTARILGARGWTLVRHVYLPAVSVAVLSTCRVYAGLALMGAVVGEYLGATQGVGMVIAFGQSMLNARDVMAGLVVLLAIIRGIDWAASALERRASLWRLVEEVGA